MGDHIGSASNFLAAIRRRTPDEVDAYTNGLSQALNIIKEHDQQTAITILESAIRLSRV